MLSTTDCIIPDDLRASYPSAIHEETPECEGEEKDRTSGQDKGVEGCRCSSGEAALAEGEEKCKDFPRTPGTPDTPTIVLTPPDPCINFALNKVNYLDSRTMAGPLFPMVDAGSLQEGPLQLLRDDLSDCTSYLSLASTASEFTLSPDLHGEKRHNGHTVYFWDRGFVTWRQASDPGGANLQRRGCRAEVEHKPMKQRIKSFLSSIIMGNVWAWQGQTGTIFQARNVTQATHTLYITVQKS